MSNIEKLASNVNFVVIFFVSGDSVNRKTFRQETIFQTRL